MRTKKNKKYLSIGLACGMVGIDLLVMLLFAPLIFILPFFMNMEIVQFIYYLVGALTTFFILFNIRKSRTHETKFCFISPKIVVLFILIVASWALVIGIIYPLCDLIPWPDFILLDTNYQDIPEFDGKFANLLEKLNNDYPVGIITFLLMVVIAPVFEELIFRGIILDGLLKRYSASVSILTSSILFGIIHLNLLQFIAGFISGVFLGWVYYKRRNLILPIIIHASINLIGFINLYYQNRVGKIESLMKLYGGILPYIVIIGISISLFVMCILYFRKSCNEQSDMINN